jgi:tRNA U38,U39,U40 pseudouridine synthase TruA
MPRYLLEVAYKGTNYAGFQIQQNANTIQAEVEKAEAPKKKSAPRKKKEVSVSTEGPIRGDYYKQVR